MKKFFKRPLAFMLGTALAVSMIGTVPYTAKVAMAMEQQSEKISVAGSKMELTVGDTKLVSTSTAGEFDKTFDTFGNKTYAILTVEDDYEVWGYVNPNTNEVEELAIQPTCYQVLELPGIYVKGAGKLSVFANTKDDGTGKVFDERQISLILNKLPDDSKGAGHAVYADFFTDEEGGRPSDKFDFNIENGLMVTNNNTGVTTSSTVIVKGTLMVTSFCVSDIATMSFGTFEAPIDHAFEFLYRQKPMEYDWDRDECYDLEINGAIVNSYITESFVANGTYLDGPSTVPSNFTTLWVYNQGEVHINEATAANSANIIGMLDNLRVMTGGYIDVKASTGDFTSADYNLPNAISSYFSSLGSYQDIGDQNGRITDYVKTIACELDIDAEDYDSEANPYPHEFSEGRYKYSIAKNSLSLESTSSSLEIIGIRQNIANGHFEVEAGSGLMNSHGDFWAEYGTEVTFSLIPDPGYQYKKGTFTVNDSPVESNVLFTATDDPGVYIYTMGKNACYINCQFEEVKDDIDVADAANVSSAAIDMGGNALPGTMEFDVEDTSITDSKLEAAVEELAGSKEIGEVLDLSLTQKIERITDDGAWVIPITELEEDMEVSLKLKGDAADNTDYSVIRVHDGIAEELDSKTVNYNPTTDTLQFATDRYSTYAIAYKKIPATLKLSSSKATLYTGKAKNQITIKPTVTGKSSKVTWKSSNTKVATVKAGVITAVSKGSAKITATANGITKSVTVTVKNPTITIKNKKKKAVTTATIKKGKKAAYTVSVNPSKSGISLKALSKKQKGYISASLNKGILTITGKKKGTVTLTLKSGKGTKSFKVTIK